jgi:hypothetical protein
LAVFFGSKLFVLSAALFTSIQMSLNKSFASFTLSNAVLGKIEESSLIMATFPPMSSFVSVLASWYQASPPTEASIAVMSTRLHREGAYSVQHILAS